MVDINAEKTRRRIYLGFADMKNPPQGYDKYIWLSEGCLKGIKWCKDNGKEYEVILNDWKNKDKTDKAVRYLKKIREMIIKDLSRDLNDYHYTNYSIEVWKILLYGWLREWLTSYYDKYLIIKRIIDGKAFVECDYYDLSNPIPPYDYLDYNHKVTEMDEYQRVQYSLILSIIGQGSVLTKRAGQEYEVVDNKLNENAIKEHTSLKDVLRSFVAWIREFCCHDPRVAVVRTDTGFYPSFIRQSLYRTKGRLLWLDCVGNTENYIYNRILNRTQIDAEWRLVHMTAPVDSDEFTKLLYCLLRRELPIVYLEGHGLIKERIENRYKKLFRVNSIIYGVQGVLLNDYEKTMLALLRQKGKYLYGMQHGGTYGVESCWLFDDEFYLCDRYYTWGWSLNNENRHKYISMPSVKMMRYHSLRGFSPHGQGTDILYITYSSGRYFYRFLRLEIILKEFLDGECAIIKCLNPEIKNRLIMRLYPSQYGWDTVNRIKSINPSVVFDTNPMAVDSMLTARLIVISAWATVVNEALFLNKPFIFLCYPNCFVNEAKDDIDDMKQVGIACETWDILRSRIEEIADKPEKWWNEPERQKVVKRIREKHAYCPNNAEELWMSELLRLCGTKQ